ncbi:hypothetical protein COO58_02800 [Micromonospora sp. WMMA1996]|nr:hypothetical protein COO58_02800 [Micromonospora sp. WMMA1996]
MNRHLRWEQFRLRRLQLRHRWDSPDEESRRKGVSVREDFLLSGLRAVGVKECRGKPDPNLRLHESALPTERAERLEAAWKAWGLWG